MLFIIIAFTICGLGLIIFENKYRDVKEINGKLEYKYTEEEKDKAMKRYFNVCIVLSILINIIVYSMIAY